MPATSPALATTAGTPFGILATIPVGVEPSGIDYDSALGEVFVANRGSDNVSVLSGAQDDLLASVPLPSAPSGVAYDSITGDVYVSEPTADRVAIISDSNNTAFASLGVEAGPTGVAFDPAKGYVLVVNAAAAAVSLICDAQRDPCYTGAAPPPNVSAVIGVGYDDFGWTYMYGPLGVAYDLYNGDAFVTEPGSSGTGHNVSVISTLTESVTATIGVGVDPIGVAYDETAREAAVANSGSDTVSLLSDADLDVVATVPVGSKPSAVGFDPQAGDLFVANSGSNNLSVISLDSDTVVQTIPVGADPDGIAFDARQGELFVSNRGSDTVTVLSVATERAVASVRLPPDPWGAAYAAAAGEVFVTNRGPAPDNVTVISDATDTVTATIPLGDSPAGLAYDSSTNDLYVANSGDGTVSVVSVDRNAVVATIPVGDVPLAVAYDPGKNEVFVANDYSFNVSVISDATNKVVATISVGQNPVGLAYDPQTAEVLAVNYESDDVSVISDATDHVVATIPVGSNPVAAAYDSATGDVLVTNSGQDNVSVVSPSQGAVVGTIPVGSTPTGITYDPATNEAFVVNSASDTVSVVWVATDEVVQNISIGSDGQGAVYDSGRADVFVVNAGSGNLSVLSAPVPTYTVTFSESGLPAGTGWSVTLDGTTPYRSDVGVLSVQEAAGSYTFSVGRVPGHSVTPTSGDLTVDGSEVSEPLVFTAPTFSVTFLEASLPAGAEWWVNVTSGASYSSTEATISALLENGTYQYNSSAAVPGFVTRGMGFFTVAGAALEVAVLFERTELFDVTITETGLPTGTKWWATPSDEPASTSTTSTLDFQLKNGSYTYQIASSAKSYFVLGVPRISFTVRGSPLTPVVAFRFYPKAAYFTETGLPLGTNWSVELNGSVANSTAGALHFLEADGSYDFSVGTVPGYTASPAAGSIEIDGASSSTSVSFALSSNFAVSVSASPSTVGAAQPAPLSVTLTATASGGSAPYSYAWTFGDGTSGSGGSLAHTYTNPGTYVATVTATDASGESQTGSAIVEVGSGGEMTPWIPAEDAYSFGNPGSVWAENGNCYGLSSTSVLYFDRQAGNTSAPFVPDDPTYYPSSLPYLSLARSPSLNNLGEWDSFDNVTLAIYLHQISGLNRVGGSWNNGAAATAVVSALEETDDPVVIALGPAYLHAVVVYGAQTETNGSIEFAISDPNVHDAAETTNAWFVPPETFHYRDGYTWTDFRKFPSGPFWLNPGASTPESPWSVNVLTGGWQLVEASEAVTVSSGATDSFTDDDAGDSETFSAYIPGSAGIEEGSSAYGFWQAYLVPPGDAPVTVDPSGSSILHVVYGSNTSGVRALRGALLELSAGATASYSFQRTNDGFVLQTGDGPTSFNVTMSYATDAGWDQLNATGLEFGAAETVVLNVTDWTGLNSTTVPSVEIEVKPTRGPGSVDLYRLSNGQDGLGAPVGATPGRAAHGFLGLPPPEGYLIVGAGAAVLVAAVVVVGVRRRARGPGHP